MLSVEAKYYAGGGLANAETNWTVTAQPTNYTPPNRGDFTFGTWVPWWRIYDYGEYSGRGGYYGGGKTETFKGVTDASGKHLLKIDFQSVKPPRPYTISASSSVQDVNRQTWSSSTSLLVHPSSLYIGIKTPRTFVQKGEKIDVESIVTDIDGNLVAGRDAEIKAVLKDWTFEKGAWVEKVIDEQSCTVKSADKPQNCSIYRKAGRAIYDHRQPSWTTRSALTKASSRSGYRAAKRRRNATSSRKKCRSFRAKRTLLRAMLPSCL